ncbi:glycosyltransferase family 39 protein [Hoyosella sp. YIM 151337]|uniref:ArnT family glycosyltransferase n=1 Tax=Hoyosella sp. YIM 151337 TaxID=2992742 RepID=UPI00223695D5|nr:glycosyltransferase family 39 protein [Hoyosella sp. YIM 151337]MCW4353632.1 glycosyltransferase family 39 protein [Hoyosella sp. YIM 151337]
MKTLTRPLTLVWLSASLAYLAIGGALSLRYGYLMGDALARVSSVESVLYSRDPHLAALGFIFTPLTALLQLPLVALSPLVPEITRWGLSGVIISAVFMGAAVAQIWGIATDRGVPRGVCFAVAVLVALNPMIVFYGANGMSEAPFLFFVLWATRRLLRWLYTDDVDDLVVAGIALAGAYLTRYDAIVVVGAAVGIMSVICVRRGSSGWRVRGAVLDIVILALPFIVALVLWAGASWILTGEAFAQFSSQYGNTAILEAAGVVDIDPVEGLMFSVTEIVLLSAALPALLPVSIALAIRRRELDVALPLALCGSVLAFQTFAYSNGMTFPFLRFYICAVPLAALLALHLWRRTVVPEARRPGEFPATPAVVSPTPRFGGARLWGVAALAASLPITAAGMLHPTLSSQQFGLISILPVPVGATAQAQVDADAIARSFSTERRLADYLDAQDLPDGSVLTDTVYGFAVVVASSRPRQFVIPSDGDFVTILNDPVSHGVRYLLAVPNDGRGATDALNRRYPTLYENGAQIATLELEVPNDGFQQPPWRLYRVSPEVE